MNFPSSVPYSSVAVPGKGAGRSQKKIDKGTWANYERFRVSANFGPGVSPSGAKTPGGGDWAWSGGVNFMRLIARFSGGFLLLLLGLTWGCNLPPSGSAPPLTAQAARQTLDQWNPKYCKVAEFYGFHQPGAGDTRVAYLLLANPGDPAQPQVVFEARFQLVTKPDGQPQWFLTSLISQSAGLSRRQGWDNLFIPVKGETPAPAK